jgi:hypothetical protein
MATDGDRVYSRKRAQLIYENHVKNGRGGCDANHIAADIPYVETLYRGLLTECAYAHDFGAVINANILDLGDGGRDFPLDLLMPEGVRTFIVNVKSKSVRSTWEALRRSGTHLRVPVKECNPATIYVFGIYLERTDDAEVLRWDWGQTLIRANERAVFPRGNGSAAYIRQFEKLRDLQELKDKRFVRKTLVD